MGILRTLLALAVVFGHSYGFVFTGGVLAVQIFYIISGYLISLILLSNQSYSNLINFYINRALRLFPIYWVVALISLLAYFVFSLGGHSEFFDVFNNAAAGKTLLFISNITLIGQDWVMFLGIFDGSLSFTSNFRDSDVLLWKALLVPQAWTIGLEITFYLLAPFILFDKKKWLTIFSLAILLKFYLHIIGIGNQDPFSYRFFPAELSLFLLGVFSHQIVKPIYDKSKIVLNSGFTNLITFFILIYVACFHLLPLNRIFLSGFLIGIIFISLPFLASFQKKNSIDIWIGNLSYPIYICHWIVIETINYLFKDSQYFGTTNYFSLIILTTLFCAYLLEVVINRRFNKLRQKYRST